MDTQDSGPRACLRRAWLLTALLGLVASASAPSQDTAPAAEDNADILASEALTLVQHQRLDLALEKLRRAVELAPDRLLYRFRLATVLLNLGRHREARAAFAELVAEAPENSGARQGEVAALLLLEDYAAARRRLEAALEALPRDGQLAHALARLLATAPADGVRDGRLAVRLAEEVYEVVQTPTTGETLAMAYAEAGDLERAIELQRRLVTTAEERGDGALVEALRQRLVHYLGGTPWRAASGLDIVTATRPSPPR